jgi:hypothetical protein
MAGVKTIHDYRVGDYILAPFRSAMVLFEMVLTYLTHHKHLRQSTRNSK